MYVHIENILRMYNSKFGPFRYIVVQAEQVVRRADEERDDVKIYEENSYYDYFHRRVRADVDAKINESKQTTYTASGTEELNKYFLAANTEPVQIQTVINNVKYERKEPNLEELIATMARIRLREYCNLMVEQAARDEARRIIHTTNQKGVEGTIERKSNTGAMNLFNWGPPGTGKTCIIRSRISVGQMREMMERSDRCTSDTNVSSNETREIIREYNRISSNYRQEETVRYIQSLNMDEQQILSRHIKEQAEAGENPVVAKLKREQAGITKKQQARKTATKLNYRRGRYGGHRRKRSR